jgi:hypothetical protein
VQFHPVVFLSRLNLGVRLFLLMTISLLFLGYDDEKSNTLAVSPSHSPSASPDATEKNGISPSPKLKSFAYALTVLLASFFAFF